jgi:hypothetical protein
MRIFSSRWALVLAPAALLAIGVGIAVAQAVGPDAPDPDARVLRTPAARLTTPTADQTSAFGVLRRTRVADDALPAFVVSNLNGPARNSTHGANPGLSRRLHVSGQDMWLTPGNETVCLDRATADGTVGGCQTTAAAAAGELITTQSGGPNFGATAIVAGVVPDGVSQVTAAYDDGSQEVVTVADNSYTFTAKGPFTISFTATDGTSHTLPRYAYPTG